MKKSKVISRVVFDGKTIIITEDSDPENVKLVNKVLRKLERRNKSEKA